MNKPEVAIVVFVLVLPWRLADVSMETTTESCVLNETCWNDYDNMTTTTEMPENVTESVEISNLTTPAEIKEETLQQMQQKGCFCDLQRLFCDINCCCDVDCTYENKLAFGYCIEEENRYVDTRFCDYIEYIYKNNTRYEWEVNQNGFFCIIKSNLPPQYTVQQKTEIKDVEDAVLQTANKYIWPDNKNEVTTEAEFNFTEKFVQGRSLFLVKNNRTLQKFSLPAAFITNQCGRSEEIQFLQNFKSKCAHYEFSDALKPGTYFKNLTLVSVPLRLKKPPDFRTCPRNICIVFHVNVCDEDFENCGNVSSTTSENLLAKKIKYNIYHNGTKGINRVDLFLIVENGSFATGFYQEFEVNFYWTNYTLNYSSILSGNPGYKTKTPILIGSLVNLLNVTKISGTNLTETKQYYAIAREFNDVAKNFMVFPANRNGFCKLNNSTHVKVEFGFNAMFKCKIAATINKTDPGIVCKNVQKYIFDQWSVIYNKNMTRVVARFGNANAANTGEWLKILQNKQPTSILNSTSGQLKSSNKTIACSKIISRLSVTIFHSRVDTKYYSNQEKVVGVLFKYGIGKDFEFLLQEGRVVFEIPAHVDVMFVDTTKPKVKKFVEPPTFKIRLPYDFFYPFIKINSNANCVKIDVFLSLVVLVTCFIL